MINAEEARQFTQSAISKHQKEQLMMFEDHIRKAVSNGHYEINEAVEHVFPENLKLLEDLGYKCITSQLQAGGDWVTINWKKEEKKDEQEEGKASKKS